MKPTARVYLCLLILGLYTSASAEPAAWYIWESKLNAYRVCAQTSPGEGWVKRLGPFKNAQCH